MRDVMTLMLALLLVGCATKPNKEATRAEEELSIAEAVFRHQFANNASGAKRGAAAYFIELMGEDPTPAFLERFTGHEPTIHPGSGFEIGKGLKFRVEKITWIDPNTVEVEGGYYEGRLSASGNVYRLIRQGPRWIVKSDRMLWIS